MATIKSIIMLVMILGNGQEMTAKYEYTAPCSVSQQLVLNKLDKDAQTLINAGVVEIKMQCTDLEPQPEAI